MRPNGFIQLTFLGWIAVAALGCIAATSAWGYIQTKRLDAVKAEYATFQATITAQGEIARKAARAKELDDLKRKETADATNTKLRADVAALARRLRGSGDPASGVPSVPATTSRPDLQCFAADEFRRSYGTLVTDLRAIADRCAADSVDLESARRWASSQ